MQRFPTFLLVLLATATGADPTSSTQCRLLAADGAQAGKSRVAAAERPMSIFNDDVRRFRFRMEDMLVTEETAQAFVHRYRDGNMPEIIGALADARTNSLVVIAPAEAEHAIRVTLATWIVELQGLSPPPLKMQKRILEYRRTELLREMAALEVQLVGAKSEQVAQLKVRLRMFEDDLSVLEGQIQVVNRYIQRLGDDASHNGQASDFR